MLKLTYTGRFKKDVKRAALQGKDVMKLFPPVFLLMDGQDLPQQYHDHSLRGEWDGYRDFHLEPDWIVVYRVDDAAALLLERTGTHSELFG